MNDCDSLQSRVTFPETDAYALQEQKMNAAHEFGSEKRMMNSVALIEGDSEEDEEVWLEEVLFLFRHVTGGDREGNETAFVRFLEYATLLDAVDDVSAMLLSAFSECRARSE